MRHHGALEATKPIDALRVRGDDALLPLEIEECVSHGAEV